MSRTVRTRIGDTFSRSDPEARKLGDTFHKTQKDTEQSFDRIVPDWVRNSKLLENISLVPGTNRKIVHGLGRRHRGWILVRPRDTADPRVFEVVTSSQKPNTTHFWVGCIGPVTFDLLVW